MNTKAETLVEKIATGETELLNMTQICKRLEISRSTFERWRKKYMFPQPDIFIGSSARWTMDTFKKTVESWQTKYQGPLSKEA